MNRLLIEPSNCLYTHMWLHWTFSFWKKMFCCGVANQLYYTQQIFLDNFLFDDLSWKHDSMQIVVNSNYQLLTRKVFLVLWPGLKMFCSAYYQTQVHSKYFCLTVRLKNIIPWRLSVKTIYVCCTSIIHLSENICFMVWLENILQFILSGKPIWRSGLKTWFLKQKYFLLSIKLQ